MITTAPANHLRTFIDEIYGEPDDDDPLHVLGPLFSALRKQFSFSSGLFLRFDPSDLSVTVPYTHDIGPDLIQAYSDHYYRLDPYRVHLPNLRRPNEVTRMSDFVNVDQVAQGEFGEAMRMLDYFHAIAIAPFVRGIPLGAFAVHRPRRQADFCNREETLFQWFVGHAAKAMDYRQLRRKMRQPGRATMVVDLSKGRVLAVTEEACELLAAMPEGQVFALPADMSRPRMMLSGGRPYAVRIVELGAQSLLQIPAAEQFDFNVASDLTRRKLRVSADGPNRRAVVVFEQIESADDAQSKLSGLGLSPRQTQVALLLVLGKGIKEIARVCSISSNTAKEYVADVYQRLDVHTRAAFLAKMTGVGGPVGGCVGRPG